MYWQGTVSSRLALKERGIHTNTYMFPCVYLRCLFSLHPVHVVATKMQAVTITIIRCNCRVETTRHVVNKSIRSPNRTNRPNQQTCKGHCHKCDNFRMESTIFQIEHNISHSSNRTNRNPTCRVVNNIFYSPKRTDRLNRQTCRGSLSLMR